MQREREKGTTQRDRKPMRLSGLTARARERVLQAQLITFCSSLLKFNSHQLVLEEGLILNCLGACDWTFLQMSFYIAIRHQCTHETQINLLSPQLDIPQAYKDGNKDSFISYFIWLPMVLDERGGEESDVSGAGGGVCCLHWHPG